MSELPSRPRRIWLRAFYGFSPEEDGYIGWSKEEPRDRMLSLVDDGDLFMIYGAVNPETEKRHRARVIGFLQVMSRPIRDIDKSSASGMQRKREKGWAGRWTFAMPVVRAWRTDEPILLERIAPKTYQPEAGRAIATSNPPLQPEEIDRALKIKVSEVSVFGEPPIPEAALKHNFFEEAFRPSRAFPGSFGKRTSEYEDGPTVMYLARFQGDIFALLGENAPRLDKSALIKIGVSNDQSRRIAELNAGFPPASIGKWKMELFSQPYESRRAAEAAEQAFKDKADKQLQSLGGEFFRGDWTFAQLIFAQIPGVSRFGK